MFFFREAFCCSLFCFSNQVVGEVSDTRKLPQHIAFIKNACSKAKNYTKATESKFKAFACNAYQNCLVFRLRKLGNWKQYLQKTTVPEVSLNNCIFLHPTIFLLKRFSKTFSFLKKSGWIEKTRKLHRKSFRYSTFKLGYAKNTPREKLFT